MSQSNFAQDIDSALHGESVEAVVIGEYHGDGGDLVPSEKRYVPVSWEEARPWLDYSYTTGFGGAECHAIFVWTSTRVMWVDEYDGSTGLAWAPRNPCAVEPAFSGQDELDLET